MKKLIAIVFIAAIGWWYWDSRNTLSEDVVRAHYRAQLDAAKQLDAGKACEGLADEYKATNTGYGPDGNEVVTTLDKAQACEAERQSIAMLKKMQEAGGGALPDMQYEIKSIALSSDRKSAKVDGASIITIADRGVIKTTGMETLVRRNGRICADVRHYPSTGEPCSCWQRR